MKQFKMLCRYKDFGGFGYVYVYANNVIEATQFLKAQYGNLLISAMAEPV